MKNERFLDSSVHELRPDHAFNGIDLFKFLGAFMVLMIHVAPFQTGNPALDSFNFYLQSYISRIAVPYYFVSSGFLLFRKTDLYDLNAARIRNYLFKLLRLLGLWLVLLFQGGSGHLWYISSLIVAVLLVSFLLHRGFKVRSVAVMALFAYAFGVLFGDAYHGFSAFLMRYPAGKLLVLALDNVIPTTRNGLFYGFLFVLMGAIFAHKRIVLHKAVAVLGLIASLALRLAEILWLRDHSSPVNYVSTISLIPVLFFTFYLTSHLNLTNKPIYGKLRVVGLLIYFSHLFVHYYVHITIQFVRTTFGPDCTALTFPATLVLTVVQQG